MNLEKHLSGSARISLWESLAFQVEILVDVRYFLKLQPFHPLRLAAIHHQKALKSQETPSNTINIGLGKLSPQVLDLCDFTQAHVIPQLYVK